MSQVNLTVEQAVLLNQIEEAKSSQGIFQLPCGWLDQNNQLHQDVEVAEITGNEEDMLASKSVPNHRKMGTLIGRCLRRLGPVTDRGKLASIVADLLVGDRVFLLFAIRRVTLGDVYPFRVVCPSPACGKEAVFQVNLSEFETRPMNDPTRRLFEVVLPSKKPVRFHPLNGHGEEKIARLDNQADRLSLGIFGRVDMIDNKPATLADIKALTSRDRDFLRTQFDEVEGGLDTEGEFSCAFCGHEWAEEVDPIQNGFFFPSTTRKRSKRNASI